MEYFEWEGLPCIFKTYGDSVLPFDLFAASFYLVSRYEEYLPFTNDQFGRFSANQSVAWQRGFFGKAFNKYLDRKVKGNINALFSKFKFQKASL